MAFIKRTWLARIGTGLNKFIIGSPDSQGRQTLTSSPDTISQEGDVISAENLNDLEDRIGNAFDGVAVSSVTYSNIDIQSADENLPNISVHELAFVHILGGTTAHKVKMPTGSGSYILFINVYLDDNTQTYNRTFTGVYSASGGQNVVTCYGGSAILYRVS